MNQMMAIPLPENVCSTLVCNKNKSFFMLLMFNPFNVHSSIAVPGLSIRWTSSELPNVRFVHVKIIKKPPFCCPLFHLWTEQPRPDVALIEPLKIKSELFYIIMKIWALFLIEIYENSFSAEHEKMKRRRKIAPNKLPTISRAQFMQNLLFYMPLRTFRICITMEHNFAERLTD